MLNGMFIFTEPFSLSHKESYLLEMKGVNL